MNHVLAWEGWYHSKPLLSPEDLPWKVSHHALIDWDLVKGCGEKLVLILMTQVWSGAACEWAAACSWTACHSLGKLRARHCAQVCVSSGFHVCTSSPGISLSSPEMQWRNPGQLSWAHCWFELHSSSGNSKWQAGGIELHWLCVSAEQTACVCVCMCVSNWVCMLWNAATRQQSNQTKSFCGHLFSWGACCDQYVITVGKKQKIQCSLLLYVYTYIFFH